MIIKKTGNNPAGFFVLYFTLHTFHNTCSMRFQIFVACLVAKMAFTHVNLSGGVEVVGAVCCLVEHFRPTRG